METRLNRLGLQATYHPWRAAKQGEGYAMTLVASGQARAAGFSAIGSRGQPVEDVAQELYEQFKQWWRGDSFCDPHALEYLITASALTSGIHEIYIDKLETSVDTILYVIEQFLPVKTELSPSGNGFVLRIEGVSIH